MPESPSKPVTQLLIDWSHGDKEALEALMPLVYDELRRLAKSYLRRERPDHTMQGTSLVHEAYLKLVDQDVEWKGRAHFFGIAAQAMRRILLDHARSKQAAKRGGGTPNLPLDEPLLVQAEANPGLLVLDEALQELEKIEPQRARIVELRFFGGLSNEEVAEVVGISTASVQRQWAGARAWLYHRVKQ